MRTIKLLIGGCLATAVALAIAGPAGACGGFFCQNDPVDQVAERIVFTVNDDETVSSLIEISYFGEAANFSWILPIPRRSRPTTSRSPTTERSSSTSSTG